MNKTYVNIVSITFVTFACNKESILFIDIGIRDMNNFDSKSLFDFSSVNKNMKKVKIVFYLKIIF